MYINKFHESKNTKWYHGTPDARGILENGLSHRKESVRYIKDLELYNTLREKLRIYREVDEDKYFDALDKIGKTKGDYTYDIPIYMSDNFSVAKSYSTDKSPFDYQNSVPKVFTLSVDSGKTLVIDAYGDRFRMLNLEHIKRGFVKSGINITKIEDIISRFNFWVKGENMSTDTLAAIAHYLGFDCVDVNGVYDSYNGGHIKSTIRMVFDINRISFL